MILLAIFPDWNSLDSVRQAHSNLELAGLVFFALLVVAEALAHNSKQDSRKHLFDSIGIWFFAVAIVCEIAGYVYGQQNDALSEQKIRSLDALAQDAESTAKRAKTTADGAKTTADQAGGASAVALTKAANASREVERSETKITSLSSEANEIGVYVNALQSTISARRVADESGLENDLRTDFRGRHIVFKSHAGIGDDEPFWLCKQLIEIATKADVEPVDECATEPVGRIPTTNLEIDAPTIEEGQHLSMILKKQRVLNGWTVGRVTGFAVSLRGGFPLAVMVGVRPSVPLLPNANVLATPPFSKANANGAKKK